MHPYLIEAFRAQPQLKELLAQLPRAGEVRDVSGLEGSAPALLAATLADTLPNRLLVVVASGPSTADAAQSDLNAILGENTACLYPQRETLPYETGEAHLEVQGLRIEALEALLSGRVRVLVTTPRALQERAEIPERLAELRLHLDVGEETSPAALAARLGEMGFEQAPVVEQVGQFALRGGIVDLFCGAHVHGQDVDRIGALRGALIQHVEVADRLDLVAPELDAHGLGRAKAEQVEDAAAQGVLADLLHD